MTTPKVHGRWFRLTPDRVILTLLPIEGLLWLSDSFRCFAFGEERIWTVLFGIAAVGVVMLFMLAWLAIALLFGWRFQFSIRSLLILVVVAAVPCSWLALERQEARRQRQTIAAIRAAGGDVIYSYELGRSMYLRPRGGPAVVPTFLLRILGDDFFVLDIGEVTLKEPHDADFAALRTWRNLKSIVAEGENITDRGMEQLENFPDLEFLWIINSRHITASGFRHLRRLSKVIEVHLDGCRNFCDADFANLRGAASLRELHLGDTLVNGSGFAELGQLHRLSTVDLCRAPVTDEGLSGIESLPNLEQVLLGSTSVTDKGLIHLRKLTKLRRLALDGTRVNGSGFKQLSDSKCLRELFLEQCCISDEGLAGLGGLRGLRILELDDNQITDAGLRNLYPLVGLEQLSLSCNDGLSEKALRDLRRALGETKILFFNAHDAVPRVPSSADVEGKRGETGSGLISGGRKGDSNQIQGR
jgi:hypothetical protein